MDARDPALIWRPLPEATTQPPITAVQWIVHTAVDAPGPTNLYGYFERHDINLESHTWLRWIDHEQFIPFDRSADANYKANRWWNQDLGGWVGAISTETEDDGNPVGNPWNDYQIHELVRFGKWLKSQGIPAELPKTAFSPGMGYHSLYPGVWSNVVGKTCPGPTRIEQFREIVLPGIQAEENEVKDQIIFFDDGKGGNHAYRCTGGIGTYLETGATIQALKFVGVPFGNAPDKPWNATLRAGFWLVDGPLKSNV